MFCSKCGTRLDDTANFCSKCGARIQHNTAQSSQKSHNTHDSKNYTMYEVFDATNDTSTKITGFFNKIVSSPNAPTALSRFVLTDRSIITDFGEYSYQQMTVIAPDGNIVHNLFSEGYTFGIVRTSINGTVYELNYPRQDILRFCFAAICANKKIPLTSKRQMLQCVSMIYAYLLTAKEKINKLPVHFIDKKTQQEPGPSIDDMFNSFFNVSPKAQSQQQTSSFIPPEDKKPYEEFPICYERVVKNPEAHFTPEDQQLIENYEYVQELLNDFFKKYNPISNAGQNRSPFILGDLIKLMTDEDPDASAAIKKYNEQLRRKQEEERAAAEQRRSAESTEWSSTQYSPQGGNLFSSAVDRMNENNRRKQEMREEMYREQRMKKDYFRSPACKRMREGPRACSSCTLAPSCRRAGR